MNYKKNIGRRVRKGAISDGDPNNKKFKSGLLINTVKDVIDHPVLHIPAYTFEEDDSYVECRRCFLVDTHEVVDLVYHEDEGNIAFQGTQDECQDWVNQQGGMASITYDIRPIIRK